MALSPVIFSFFSGSGFLDLGFERAGFNVQFVNEYYSPFLDAYKYARKKMNIPLPRYGYYLNSIEDFMKGEESNNLQSLVEESREVGLVGFIGGPPCPDFSVAGKNKGHNGENGKLTRVYIDCIIKYQPDFFLFENVKGLWRTAKHREFYDQMKKRLEDNGYIITDHLMNCIEFGVPQNRDRILMFGVKRASLPAITKNVLEKDFHWNKYTKYTQEEVFNVAKWPTQETYKKDSYRKMPDNLKEYEELTVQYWFERNDVDNHPNAQHHFVPRQALPRFQSVLEGDDSKKSFKRLHRWRFSPTAAYGNNEVHLHPYKDRRLSAAESLAIQSLPKDFVLPSTMTLTDMFKTIGNGVPFLAAYGVARTIFDFLSDHG